MRHDDPELVRVEYTSETGLEGRRAAYRWAEGPNAPEVAFQGPFIARNRPVIFVGHKA